MLGAITVKNHGKDFLIIEPTGKKRLIQRLYFNQMIVEKNGKHYYNKEMPKDYFAKAELLKRNGWKPCPCYNYWFNSVNSKNFILTTNKAVRFINEQN